jgi:hypothetical protein
MIGHPDADALAACREGLLGRRRSARIRAHLGRCSRCASLDHELAAVTTLLASAPEPRIPDELAARLDTVLAAESAARARGESPVVNGIPTAEDTPAAADGIPATAGARVGPADGQAGPVDGQAAPGDKTGPRPGRPRSARPPRPWRITALRAASATAVLLVIAAGGYGLSRLLQTGNSGGASSTAGGPASAPRVHNGVAAPEGSGGSGTGPSRAGMRIPSGAVRVVYSGTDYQPGQLVAQAEAVLARHPAKPGGHESAASSGASIALTGCLRLFAGGAPATLVDEARYGGQPATVIIQAPAVGRPGHVWVIAPRCSAADRQRVAAAVLPASG